MDWKYLQRSVNYSEKNCNTWENTIFIQEKRVCVKPLHSRFEAIQKLRPPTRVKGCRSFAGMVNFLSIFCQDLQKILKPIYDLTRKDRPFKWDKSNKQHLMKLKPDYKSHLYCIYLTAKGDSICIQILVSMPWAVLYIRYRMGSLNW